MFAAYSGMRQGEILALTWSAVNIDCKKPFARVKQTMGYINHKGFVFRPIGKSKKALRELTLLDKATYALRQRKKQQLEEKLSAPHGKYQETDLIFTDYLGRPLDPSGLTRRFKRLATKTGFSNARFHDLRHSFATMHLEMGTHPKIVQEILGHETIGITMDTYSHAIKGIQQEAVAKVNERLANRDGGKMAGNAKKPPVKGGFAFARKDTGFRVSVVPRTGIEPVRALGPRDFKSLASASSATPANKLEAAPRIELGVKDLQSSALPLGYAALMERKTGFEPATLALARRCSTTEPLPHNMVPQGRIELPTRGFSVHCSTD